MSWEFLVTSLIVVVAPGAGVLYTLATGLARGAVSTTLARALKRLTDANSALEGEHAARG